MKNLIKQPSIHFRNGVTGEKYIDIWKELESGLWKEIKPENMLGNALIMGVDRTDYKPIIENYHLMRPGMLWDEQNKRPFDPVCIPNISDSNLEKFLIEAYRFFKQFDGKHIGVQLSGGLDSSLIIVLLKYFNIPFSLVALVNKRFEFRTESHIQNLLSKYGTNTVLIDYETCLPYSNIENVPLHQYPEEYIRTFGPDFEMSKKCKEMGIEILLTGQGGDNVFGDVVPKETKECEWMPHTFNDTWLQDLVYSPMGIVQVSFYSDVKIMEHIFKLRSGRKEDVSKYWARQFFKDFLPRELVQYTYHSDFWGFIIDGVQNVMPQIPTLFEQAYDLTQNPYFSKDKVKELMKIDLLDHKKETYMQIEPLLSIAVWLDGLVKAEIIK